MTQTYCSPRVHGRVPGNKDLMTYGGYSAENVVHQRFVFKIPEAIEPQFAGPILCAGITMYDPLVYFGKGRQNLTVGIAGIGGLGTMGIKLAAAMGHHVVAISSSDSKKEMAAQKGATGYVNIKDPESLKQYAGKCNLILNTLSADHDISIYMGLLANSGHLIQIGGATTVHSLRNGAFIGQRKTVAGSIIGGCKASQDLLNFCAEKGVKPDIEVVTADKLDWVFEQLDKAGNAGAVRYVVDIGNTLKSEFVPK